MNEIDDKIKSAISAEGLDAIIAVGVDNFTYVSHLVLPFASNYPDRQAVVIMTKDGRGSIVSPFEWGEAIKDQGWDGELALYDENQGLPPRGVKGAIKAEIEKLGLDKAKIGVDETRASKLFKDLLIEGLPDVDWTPFDGILRELRLVKTPEEVKLIESAAYQSELGIITALMRACASGKIRCG